MRIVALYKTFDGEEFIAASLASIYDQVDAIVMVHSDLSWTGDLGNTVEPVARAWAKQHDTAEKIHHVHGDWVTQEEQYAAGLEYIDQSGLPMDLLMLIDADEVWDADALLLAITKISNTRQNYLAFRTQMHTYLKSPLFRVTPAWGTPVVFLKEPSLVLESARAWEAEPHTLLGGVWFHHFTYVRQTAERVRQKILRSCVGDGDTKETVLDLDRWCREKWDTMPAARGLHPFASQVEAWEGVEVIGPEQLPEAMQGHPLVFEALNRKQDHDSQLTADH